MIHSDTEMEVSKLLETMSMTKFAVGFSQDQATSLNNAHHLISLLLLQMFLLTFKWDLKEQLDSVWVHLNMARLSFKELILQAKASLLNNGHTHVAHSCKTYPLLLLVVPKMPD
jgi:hypothetical protein